MTKNELQNIIELYKKAESQVQDLDSAFGVNIWNSTNENFYNIYNKIIFKLFESIYGLEKEQLLEEYIFEQISNFTFEDLYNYLENYEIK